MIQEKKEFRSIIPKLTLMEELASQTSMTSVTSIRQIYGQPPTGRLETFRSIIPSLSSNPISMSNSKLHTYLEVMKNNRIGRGLMIITQFFRDNWPLIRMVILFGCTIIGLLLAPMLLGGILAF